VNVVEPIDFATLSPHCSGGSQLTVCLKNTLTR
jgi:hypothetical protein